MPAVMACVNAINTVGMPARAPPTMGRKSTRATQTPHSTGYGTPTLSSATNTTTPAIIEVRKFPSMYPMTACWTSRATRVVPSARCGGIWPRIQRRILGPSSSSRRTRTKMTNSSMISENAAVPMLRAGLLSDWA